MNKRISCLIVAALMLMLPACGSNNSTTPDDTGAANDSQTSEDNTQTDDTDGQDGIDSPATTLDELNDEVASYVESEAANIVATSDALIAGMSDYDDYVANVDSVQEFYDNAIGDVTQMAIQLQQYSIDYATMVTSSDEERADQYDDIEELYDTIYEDAFDVIYDDIYDDMMDDIYDAFYDGIIDDAYDTVPYDEWYDAHSDAYDMWYDARSDIYDVFYDYRSDVYDFYSDIRSDIYQQNPDAIEKDITDFQADVDELKES